MLPFANVELGINCEPPHGRERAIAVRRTKRFLGLEVELSMHDQADPEMELRPDAVPHGAVTELPVAKLDFERWRGDIYHEEFRTCRTLLSALCWRLDQAEKLSPLEMDQLAGNYAIGHITGFCFADMARLSGQSARTAGLRYERVAKFLERYYTWKAKDDIRHKSS